MHVVSGTGAGQAAMQATNLAEGIVQSAMQGRAQLFTTAHRQELEGWAKSSKASICIDVQPAGCKWQLTILHLKCCTCACDHHVGRFLWPTIVGKSATGRLEEVASRLCDSQLYKSPRLLTQFLYNTRTSLTACPHITPATLNTCMQNCPDALKTRMEHTSVALTHYSLLSIHLSAACSNQESHPHALSENGTLQRPLAWMSD